MTIRPHSALDGMIYFDTSSKLKSTRYDVPRFWGEGKSGRPSTLDRTGDDKTDADGNGPGVADVGEVVNRLPVTEFTVENPECCPAMRPSGT